MRLLQVSWALALCGGVVLQLVCDDGAVANANSIPGSPKRLAVAAARLGGSRTISLRDASASVSASGEADSSAGADASNTAGDGDGGASSNASGAADSDAAGNSSDESGDDSGSASNEADAKPSAHRLQDVMRAWGTVKQALSLKYIGMNILLTFLKLYPEYQEFFTDLIGVPLDKMQKDKRFIALSVSFMYSLDSMMDNLDDEELVEILAKQVGQQFASLGINEKPFMDIRNLILHMVERYHKRYVDRYPLGIVESASHTIGWLWSLTAHGLKSAAAAAAAAAPAGAAGGDSDAAIARRARIKVRPRPHPHLRLRPYARPH